MGFFQTIREQQQLKKSALCVGLDPNPKKFPPQFGDSAKDVHGFLKSIVQATGDVACAFKPQIAYFSALGYEDVLQTLIDEIHQDFPNVPVILDAKRGDIGSTAEMYAREAFERYKADAVTVNAYMGKDTVEPFASYKDKGVFLLCRTSNPAAEAVQNVALADGRPYFEFLAKTAFEDWNENNNLGLVIGATAESELQKIRSLCPEAWFLVPGVGAQGGSLAKVMEYGKSPGAGGVLVNSSRGILYAGNDEGFAKSARQEAMKIVQSMEECL